MMNGGAIGVQQSIYQDPREPLLCTVPGRQVCAYPVLKGFSYTRHLWTSTTQDPCGVGKKERVPDQEGRPAGQEQSGAGAGRRFLVLFRIIEQDQELVQNS
jgi:hypothetical protein